MQHLPEAPDLVDAVAEWLEGALPSTLSGADRFNARVAVNALRIVERELRAGPTHHDRDRHAFAALVGPAPDGELVEALAHQVRAGELDDRVPELLAVLHAYTVRRLQVDNPRYLAAADREAAR